MAFDVNQCLKQIKIPLHTYASCPELSYYISTMVESFKNEEVKRIGLSPCLERQKKEHGLTYLKRQKNLQKLLPLIQQSSSGSMNIFCKVEINCTKTIFRPVVQKMLIRLGSNAKRIQRLFYILRLNCIFNFLCSMHGSDIRCITNKSGLVFICECCCQCETMY